MMWFILIFIISKYVPYLTRDEVNELNTLFSQLEMRLIGNMLACLHTIGGFFHVNFLHVEGVIKAIVYNNILKKYSMIVYFFETG